MAQNKILQQNLRFLRQWDPYLLLELENPGGGPPEVTVLAQGAFTLSRDGHHFHDPLDPMGEARRVVGHDPCRVHLHFGFGLGYFAEADEVGKDGMILVYEPDPDLVKAALATRDLRQLFQSRSLNICCSLPRFRMMVGRSCVRDQSVRLMVSAWHAQAFPGLLLTFERVIQSVGPVRGIEYVSRMYPHILEQTVRSWQYTSRLPDAALWQQVLGQQAAVIVAAGPSLDRNLATLASCRDRLILFAIARSVGPLERSGIDPDVLVHVEPQPYAHLISNRSNLAKTVFMLADQTQDLFFKLARANTYVFQSERNSFSRYLIQQYPSQQKLNVPSGGSVATVAFFMAWLAGCNPIILVGQDLALAGEKVYASDEKNQAFDFQPEDLIQVPGWSGEPVQTLPHYYQNLVWYKETAAKMKAVNPNLKLINATEGGAYLEGFQHLSLSETAKQYLKDRAQFKQPKIPKNIGLNSSQIRKLYTALKTDLLALKKLVAQQQKQSGTFQARLARMQMPDPIRDLPVSEIKEFLSFFKRNPPLIHIFGAEVAGSRLLLQVLPQCKTPDHVADAWARLMVLHEDTLLTCNLLLKAV